MESMRFACGVGGATTPSARTGSESHCDAKAVLGREAGDGVLGRRREVANTSLGRCVPGCSEMRCR